MMDWLNAQGGVLFGPYWSPVFTLGFSIAKIVAVVLPLILCVAYLTLWERKVIAWMHVRIGPNRVGPRGLFQPFADVLKLLLKEIIVPANANRPLFLLGPVMTIMPAVAAWAIVPFGPQAAVGNINAGLLYVMAITSMEVYGIIIAGWSSNSKYAFLGAMRASAQMVSYEIAMGFSLVAVLMVSASLNFSDIVAGQTHGMFTDGSLKATQLRFLSWNWLPLLPILVIYFVSGVAETNRHPFDVVEGESEIVAGHMVEYSGMGFAMFFLAEYMNMILISALCAVMFFGGWDAPLAFLMPSPDSLWFALTGFFWLFVKTLFLVTLFIWFRATFPRYRYDQIMRLGWKVFIPLTIAWLMVVGLWMQTPLNIWK